DSPPKIMATDGGVYCNTAASPTIPAWTQPKVTPQALWLFGMAGVSEAGREDLYFVCQDNGAFGSLQAENDPPRPGTSRAHLTASTPSQIPTVSSTATGSST